MKNKSKLLILLTLVFATIALYGCHTNTKPVEKEEPIESERPSNPERPDPYMEYYGCPNSKRISKLIVNKVKRIKKG